MRNVNSDILKLTVVQKISFILTMRNVNPPFTFNDKEYTYVLY